ncbi:MAG: hypothetical protein A3C15_04335 [Candidatus Magasanikbacteria bacterium RIFCSPHIGHO2_02_FULL_50_9b]|uniref:Glycoside-hydrolase family GH114 TIM-barrel domain-containing protein n=1 Tax=Candidatus Magasanikbacteria bacterium RIFCSPHIGHO2_02_FULL_50_9b TaxID=1798682 RepID=A0A1F6M840_9BACT|nr:MAG: hypothetical protein A3C15_04335 [Candidatus Magasanikbacteria bacterium RIFCSPHIGHO2_02_FULL_50_9b]
MKKICAIVLLIATLVIPSTTPISAARPFASQLANIFLSWVITRDDAERLANWDLVVLDAEVGARQKKLLQLMRARNPHIKILAYVSSNEIHELNERLTNEAPLRGKLQARLSDELFLTNATGTRVSFWPNTQMLNVTTDWKFILPEYIQEEILSTGVWDGIMLDNVWDGVTWYVGDVDLKRDGVVDAPDKANAAWERDMHALLAYLRLRAPNALLFGNGSTKFTELDGVVIENFQDRDFNETATRIEAFRAARAPKPAVVVINSKITSVIPMQYSLASALLLDAFFSFDGGEKSHAQTWWHDEYDAPFGTVGVVTTTDKISSLQRPLIESRAIAAPFEHPAVVASVYTSTGTEISAPITIAKRGRAKKIVQPEFKRTFSSQVFDTATAERLTVSGRSEKTEIKIFSGRKKIAAIHPVTDLQNARVVVTTGQFTRTGPRDIVVIVTTPDKMVIQIFTGAGALKNSFSIQRALNESVAVFTRDVDANGLDEIIVLRPLTPRSATSETP